MTRSAWFQRLATVMVLLVLVFGSACAKKKAAAEDAADGAAAGAATAAESANAGAAGAAALSEEDIPAGNRGTLDEQGRVRGETAVASAATDAENRERASGAEEAGGNVLVEDVRFAFDSSELSSGARDGLGEAKRILDEHAAWNVTLEGHCDERGTEEYNLGLGQRRADSAKRYLKSLGISGSRIDTVSFGEAYPVDPRHNEGAWAKNRRVHFAFNQAGSN